MPGPWGWPDPPAPGPSVPTNLPAITVDDVSYSQPTRGVINLTDVDVSGFGTGKPASDVLGWRMAINEATRTHKRLVVGPAPKATNWELGNLPTIQFGGQIGKGARGLSIDFLDGAQINASGGFTFQFGGQHPFSNGIAGISSGAPIVTPQTLAGGIAAPLTYYPLDRANTYQRHTSQIKLLRPQDGTTIAAALAGGFDGYCFIRCMQTIIGGAGGQPVAEPNRILSVANDGLTLNLADPLIKDYQDIVDNNGLFWIFGVALDLGGLISTDVHIRGWNVTQSVTRSIDFMGTVYRGSFNEMSLTGPSCWLPRGRDLDVKRNKMYLQPYWGVQPGQPSVYSPYWGYADTGSGDIRYDDNEIVSTGVAAAHCHEGLADIIGRRNKIDCPVVDPGNGGAPQTWSPHLNLAGFPFWNIDVEAELTDSPTAAGVTLAPPTPYPAATVPIKGLFLRGKYRGNFGARKFIASTGLVQILGGEISVDTGDATTTDPTPININSAAPSNLMVGEKAVLPGSGAVVLPSDTRYSSAAKGTAGNPEQLIVPIAGFSGDTNPAVQIYYGSNHRVGWSFPKGAPTAYLAHGVTQLPPSWSKAHVYVFWVNASAVQLGNVRWQFIYEQAGNADNTGVAPSEVDVTAAAAGQDIGVLSLFTPDPITVDPTKSLGFRLQRNAAAGTDTLAATAIVAYVLLTKAG